MIFCKFNWGWYHFYFLVVKYNTEKYLMVFNIFIDGLQYFYWWLGSVFIFRTFFGTTNLGLSVQIVIKLFFEQFLKLQRRRDVVNLMPKKLIVVASNFFLWKNNNFLMFFLVLSRGRFSFFFNHKMICIRDR